VSEYIFKMPDLGEGTVEAEIVAWHVKPGDAVSEDKVIVEVMTDKAAVEVPSPVSGRIVSLRGEPGDKIAVGAPLIVFDTSAASGAPAGAAAAPVVPGASSRNTTLAAPASTAAAPRITAPASSTTAAPAAAPASAGHAAFATTPASSAADVPAAASVGAEGGAGSVAGRGTATRVMASPATRRRAREAGIDLGSVAGSGPGGRILKDDLQSATAALRRELAPPSSETAPRGGAAVPAATTEIKIIGVRRVIAERMSEAKRNIPHFAYVEEVDVTELEALRQHLNAKAGERGSLTYLPFIVTALVRVLESFPQCNALYDAARGVLVRHAAVHVGIATQTPDGLKVPVLRDAHNLGLWQIGAEIRRLSERARNNQATRNELVGSTITVTSLGKLGGIASTPVINAPEVAIIGLNKAVERPVVQNGAIAVRRIMNLSSSFDHRFVDGYDAAAMIQSLKEMLEHPATLFIPKSSS